MIILALVSMATAAAAETAGEISGGEILGLILGAIFTAGGGIWIGRKGGESAAEKSWAEKEQKIRAEIASELRTKIVNDPMHIEQSHYQADMKANAAAHTDIFGRLRSLESDVAGIKATITARFDGLSAQLMETREMVRSLYDKVCNGKRK